MMPDPQALLPVAYRAAARVVRNRFLAEEAGERAFHLLTLEMLRGRPPHHPEAWLRVVARRSACAILRSEWARTQTIDRDDIERVAERRPEPKTGHVEMVREQIATALSPRQRDALDAALACNGTRAAARRCGMQPRDFRRSLGAIGRKARRALERTHGGQVSLADPANAS